MQQTQGAEIRTTRERPSRSSPRPLDRLRNALLDHDEDSRPDMTQVLLSTYLNEAEEPPPIPRKISDRAAARQRRIVRGRSGKKTGKIEAEIQITRRGIAEPSSSTASGGLEAKQISVLRERH